MQEPEESLTSESAEPVATTPEPEPPAPATVAEPLARVPFWRRLGAFLIDGACLAALFLTGSLFLTDAYMAAGPWGRMIGGLAGVLYFAVGASPLFQGRTAGKALLRIATRRIDGSLLTTERAILRALVMMTPLTLNGMQVGTVGPAVLAMLSVVVFGGNVALLYLFCFNRPSRRSLHDLVAGSVVVYRDGNVPHPAFRRRHAIALLVVLAALAGAMAGFTYLVRQRIDTSAMQRLQRQIGEVADTPSVNVMEGSTSTNGVSTSWVSIAATTYEEVENREEIARAIVVLTLRQLRAAHEVDRIDVTFRAGYDMLFCSAWEWHTESHSVTEWRQMIDASDAAR